MRVSAKVDYAVRAMVELAAADTTGPGHATPMKSQALASAQAIPPKFLESILADLKRGRLVASQRGADGGYWLARPPDDITVAEIIRAVEGPLADVRGVRPESLGYDEDRESLQRMWIAVRANLRSVLERVTVADLHRGKLDPAVDALADPADAWLTR